MNSLTDQSRHLFAAGMATASHHDMREDKLLVAVTQTPAEATADLGARAEHAVRHAGRKPEALVV